MIGDHKSIQKPKYGYRKIENSNFDIVSSHRVIFLHSFSLGRSHQTVHDPLGQRHK